MQFKGEIGSQDSQVLNFLWLNLDLPAPEDPKNGIRQPLPEKYIENVRKAGAAHPAAEIDLWVDSKRLTKKQLKYIELSIEDGLPNVHLRDLRSIPATAEHKAYDKESLYNQAEKDPYWRDLDQTALIWRQVDAAKILVCLQGNFDQTFFADLDHAHLDIESDQVQGMIKKHGLLIGSSSCQYAFIENQLWGFDHSRRKFFEQYYAKALEDAYKGDNAWNALTDKVDVELERGERIPLEEICLLISDDGTRAEQPGHQWRNGSSKKGAPPEFVSAEKLTAVFRRKANRSVENAMIRKARISSPGSVAS